VNPRLEGYTAAVLETADREESARLAADLAAIDHLFVTNEALRTVMSDTSVPGPARRAVLDELLEGKVSDRARRVAAFAASAVPGAEVPGAMTWLSHRARRAAEGLDEPMHGLGHLAARQRVGGFAAALYEDLPIDRLEEVEDELFRFARTVETTPALRAALSDRDLPVDVRRGVVDDLLGGKVQPATIRLVDFVVAGGRPRDVVGTLFWLVDATAEARGWRVALVDSAREIDDQGRRSLSESLGRLVGAPVELQVRIEPELLAGVRVRIGDLQVDATARDRLDRLREHVVTGGWENRGFGSDQGGTG
jgi:F-type H+-transporting ATPase subunit delta